MNVWKLIGAYIKGKAPSAVRAVMQPDLASSDLTGKTSDAQGFENEMNPTKANPALVAVLVGRMRGQFKEVHLLTIDMSLTEPGSVNLTAYGMNHQGEKIRTTEHTTLLA